MNYQAQTKQQALQINTRQGFGLGNNNAKKNKKYKTGLYELLIW